jgi:2Fe-2S ferredoxin
LATVRVEPSGIEFEALADESIMAAAVRHGLSWPTLCQGMATCSVCVIEIREGPDAFCAMSRTERGTLESSFPTLERRGFPLRLACQARIVGPDGVVVFKRGVRRSR